MFGGHLESVWEGTTVAQGQGQDIHQKSLARQEKHRDGAKPPYAGCSQKNSRFEKLRAYEQGAADHDRDKGGEVFHVAGNKSRPAEQAQCDHYAGPEPTHL